MDGTISFDFVTAMFNTPGSPPLKLRCGVPICPWLRVTVRHTLCGGKTSCLSPLPVLKVQRVMDDRWYGAVFPRNPPKMSGPDETKTLPPKMRDRVTLLGHRLNLLPAEPSPSRGAFASVWPHLARRWTGTHDTGHDTRERHARNEPPWMLRLSCINWRKSCDTQRPFKDHSQRT